MSAVCNLAPFHEFQELKDLESLQPHLLALGVGILSPDEGGCHQREGSFVEPCLTVFFLGSKITADDDCSHEIKRHFLLGRKAMTNLNNVLWGRKESYMTE